MAIQSMQIKKPTGMQVIEIGLSTLIYFHLNGFAMDYYRTLLLKIPEILQMMGTDKCTVQ
jgi:hypothetical protein